MTDQNSSEAEKISLFRSLFRGREDVFARRFESAKTGKSGYQPACAVEWVRGVCDKPRVKCEACPMRQLMPVTDAVIRQHLTGRDDAGKQFVAGIYPLLTTEQCRFLAEDVSTCLDTVLDTILRGMGEVGRVFR